MDKRLELTEEQKKFVYAEEADVLNVALFGMTAKEWKENNPDLKRNIRDYADLKHLLILCNLENTNAELINDNIPQNERLIKLNNSAIRQMKVLENDKNIKELEILNKNLIYAVSALVAVNAISELSSIFILGCFFKN